MNVKGFGNPPSEKVSKGIARCLLTGVGALVLSYLLWKTVMFVVPNPPISFHFTTGAVALMTLCGTGMAIRRLHETKSERRAVSAQNHRKVQLRDNVLIGVSERSGAVGFSRN